MSALRLVVLATLFAATSPGIGASGLETAAPVRLVVMGDTGTGDAGQYAVAAAIADVCAARGCDAVVINGDLVYDTGVGSAYDPQFVTKFESPYASLDLPFFLTLGNHDNADPLDQGTGTDSGRGDHMVSYHYRTDTSGKWRMPARYYAVDVGDVRLVSLDTNTMMSYGLVRKGTAPVATANAQDPAMLAQGAFVDEALANDGPTWRIAFGHHPLYSNGAHGNAGAYESQGVDVAGDPFPTTLGLGVKAFLEAHVCGKADLYLAGHDHDLQWLVPNPSCGATQLIVSGAGAKSRELQDPTRNPAYFQRGETEGFFWLELRADELVGAVYDSGGTLLFEQTIDKALPPGVNLRSSFAPKA